MKADNGHRPIYDLSSLNKDALWRVPGNRSIVLRFNFTQSSRFIDTFASLLSFLGSTHACNYKFVRKTGGTKVLVSGVRCANDGKHIRNGYAMHFVHIFTDTLKKLKNVLQSCQIAGSFIRSRKWNDKKRKIKIHISLQQLWIIRILLILNIKNTQNWVTSHSYI